MDSDKREYLPAGITEVLSSFDFIERGYNLCILGESDAGKSYLAKAIGIKAATDITSVTFTARNFWKAW